jgi:hypothetical protein
MYMGGVLSGTEEAFKAGAQTAKPWAAVQTTDFRENLR